MNADEIKQYLKCGNGKIYERDDPDKSVFREVIDMSDNLVDLFDAYLTIRYEDLFMRFYNKGDIDPEKIDRKDCRLYGCCVMFERGLLTAAERTDEGWKLL